MDEPDPDRLRIHVVADDPLARGALKRSLEEAGVVVTGALAADGAASVQGDVLVWDLGPDPRGDTEPFADRLRSDVPVLALVPDDETSPLAARLGARGIVYRDATGERLGAAISAVAQGFVVREPGALPSATIQPSEDAEELTPREREVLSLLVEGLSNKLIAARLGISDHTAKFHVNAVLQKLGATTRTEAVVRAVRTGIVTL